MNVTHLPDENDVVSSSFVHNPYPVLARLRAEHPVYFSQRLDAWLVTGYEQVVEGLSHQAVSADRITPRLTRLAPRDRAQLSGLAEMLSRWPLLRDQPDHRRLRPTITRTMGRVVLHRFAPLVERAVERLLDRARAQGEIDAVAELAVPLPLYVLLDLLGLPREMFGMLKRCAVDIVSFFGSPPDRYLPTAQAAARSVDEAAELLRPFVLQRAHAPGQDLISGLLGAQTRHDQFDVDEIVATCIMMVFAGFETTTNLLSNGLLLLLRHPDQLSRLRDDPRRTRLAVEEMLRFESPVQRLSRMTLADVALGGQRIPAGDLVFFMVGAANRDPAAFVNPDRLDLSARRGRHLAFGHWIHSCPGSALARLEADVFFRQVCARFPAMRLSSQNVRWHDNLSVRALRSLPIIVT